MKIYILEDLEGVSGVGCPKNRQSESELVHAEVNAVIEGARTGGATEIVVGDWHNMGGNLSISKLSQPVRLSQYNERDILKKEKFDLVFVIGLHARAGLPAILAHTEEYFIKNIFVDDKPVGETTLVFHYLNNLGIPVGGIFGSREAIDEVRDISKGTVFVETKHGFECEPVEQTQKLIQSAAEKAVREKKARIVKTWKAEVVMEYKDGRKTAVPGKNIGECYENLMKMLS